MIHVVGAPPPPFWPAPPRNRRVALPLTPRSYSSGTLQSRMNVYHANALPREPIRIVRGQPEQTVAWPKHGVFIQSAQRSALTGEETGVQVSSKVRSDPHLQEK